jgi:hypothetical protein
LNKGKSNQNAIWKKCSQLDAKNPLLMASFPIWKNPIRDNPILKKGKSHQKENRF